jgi:branched-chain amino acid transport system permease protein
MKAVAEARSLSPRTLRARGAGAALLVFFILTGPKLFTTWGPTAAYDFGLTVAMLVLAMSVLGWIGEISLAVVAQMGLGMIVLSWLQENTHLPLLVALVLVALSSIPVSLLLGLFALRLRGVNFVIASLALAGMAQKAFFQKVLGAATSLHGRVSRPHFIATDGALYYLIVFSLVGIVVGLYLLQRSRVGTALAAMRDSETAFWTLGYSPAEYKLFIVCLSGAIATLAGAYYGLLQGTVPSFYFNPGLAIVYFGFAMAGGMGSIAGAVGAGLFFGALPKYLETIWQAYSKWDFVFYGLVALVIIVEVPGGLSGIGRRLWRRVEGHA